jgi:signal transduction histidine kinase
MASDDSSSRSDGDRQSEPGTEPIRLVIRQLPVVLGTTIVNSAIIAVVLSAATLNPTAIAWAALVSLLAVARLPMALRLRRQPIALADIGAIERRLLIGSGLSGILWGGAAFALFPSDRLLQLFLTFVFGGMAAGATVTLSPLPHVYRAYLVPSVLLLAARYFVEGTAVDTAMAAMITVFAGALYVIGSTLNASLTRMLRLQREKEQLVLELSEALRSKSVAEEQLRQSQKMEAVGQLTSGLAHDFGNFLTTILGTMEILEQRVRGDATLSALVATAMRAATRGETVTKQLLSFARRQRLEPKAIDLTALINNIRDLLGRTLGSRHRLEIHFPPGLPPALADANQLETALLNLVLNARDAMPEGGTVGIRACALSLADGELAATLDLPPGDYVELSVTDTGTGMTDFVKERAFEPFFTTKEVGKGTGLGLAMVYGFSRQSSGAVHIDTVEGGGTAVHLVLPVPPPRAAASDTATTLSSSAAPER